VVRSLKFPVGGGLFNVIIGISEHARVILRKPVKRLRIFLDCASRRANPLKLAWNTANHHSFAESPLTVCKSRLAAASQWQHRR
jgi:hypothetical protein